MAEETPEIIKLDIKLEARTDADVAYILEYLAEKFRTTHSTNKIGHRSWLPDRPKPSANVRKSEIKGRIRHPDVAGEVLCKFIK